MSDLVTFFGLIGLGIVVGGAVVVGLVTWAFVRTFSPSVTVLEAQTRAAAAAGRGPAGPGEWPVGHWNARVTPGQLTLNPWAGFGEFRVENGWLAFAPEGEPSPAWVVALAECTAGRNARLLPALVWLHHHTLGRVEVEVSIEHLNRISNNDFKRGREVVYADAFLDQLGRSGATIT